MLQLRLVWWVASPDSVARATVGPWEVCAYREVSPRAGYHWWVARGWTTEVRDLDGRTWELAGVYGISGQHPTPRLASSAAERDLRAAAAACEAAMEATGLLLPARPPADGSRVAYLARRLAAAVASPDPDLALDDLGQLEALLAEALAELVDG